MKKRTLSLVLVLLAVPSVPVLAITSQPEFLLKWGEQGSGDGQFNRPYGVAVDNQGHVYVADTSNYRIQKSGFTPGRP